MKFPVKPRKTCAIMCRKIHQFVAVGMKTKKFNIPCSLQDFSTIRQRSFGFTTRHPTYVIVCDSARGVSGFLLSSSNSLVWSL